MGHFHHTEAFLMTLFHKSPRSPTTTNQLLSDFYHSETFFSILAHNENGILQYMFFCVLLLLFNI